MGQRIYFCHHCNKSEKESAEFPLEQENLENKISQSGSGENAYLKSHLLKIIFLQKKVRSYLKNKKLKEDQIDQKFKSILTSDNFIKSNAYISQLIQEIDNKFAESKDIKEVKLQDKIKYKGEILKNKKHGYGIQIWPDGTIYRGEWKDDNANGKGILIHSNGDKFFGEFINEKAYGYGVYIHKNGVIYEGRWVNDLQEGHGKETWPW